MKKSLLATAAVLIGTVLAGCGHGYMVASASYGPPPPRYGVIGYAPGPGYVWTEGYWNYAGGHWDWVGGRWMRPPHPRAVYVRPEWRHDGNRWRFRHGYWR